MLADKSEQYQKHREKMAERMRNLSAQARDIGALPEICDPDRRDACEHNLKEFCEQYRPSAFHLGWSEDHLVAIERLERAVLHGGTFALAMPRGSGKSTLTITAALWSLLYGHRMWVCLIGATGPKASKLLKGIKTELRFNQALLDDFPEVCWPIKCLEGKAARAAGQTYQGQHTNISWLTDSIKLPNIEGSKASGSLITVAGITGDIRGQQEVLEDGTVIRPSFVIADDPQTRESSKSSSQTDDRLSIIQGDVLGLAGPGCKIAGVIPCTVVTRGDVADQLLDRELNPEFNGHRTQLVYGWPKKMSLWHKYQEIREAELRNNGTGQEANQFYLEHQVEMDDGIKAAWPERHNQDEASAVQHAMNLFFRSESAFWAEYMNQPLEAVDDETLSEDEITRRISTVARGVVPLEADLVTAFVDVQKEMLFWVVTAWRKDFTGWVIDYGGWPDQGTNNFRYNQAKKTISKQWPGQGIEATLRLALEECINELCGKSWLTVDGAELNVSKLMIDANWGISRNIVYSFCRESSHRAVIMPSHGKYVGASSEPLNAHHARKVGMQVGTHWRIDKAKDASVRHCLYDTNHWKSQMFSKLGTLPGTPGSLTLFEARPAQHKTFAKHLKAEYPVRTEGRGREVDEWKLKPDRPDNHWLDCLVGCCVAGSMMGCDVLQPKSVHGKKEKRRRSVEVL